MHEHPSLGERHPVGKAIVDSLFAEGSDGRIPVVAITGTNGKTTTTLVVAHVLQRLGRVTGVVLNVDRDHLGHDGIDTVEALAAVKGLVVETARKAAVLNADDPICAGLARRAPRGTEIIYFGFDAASPVMAAHLAAGGRAVFEHKGMLRWAEGGHQAPLVAAAQLPSTFGGRARHNVANAMAAFAALLALSVPRERIVAGLASFRSNEIQNPLRMNVFRSRGVTLMVDYAHNTAAYRAVISTARQMTAGRLVGVVAAPGDRLLSDLEAIGRVCAAGCDALVVYEMDDRRGQPRGATAKVIAGAAREAGTGAQPLIVLDVREAIREALRQAEPGDLVLVGCASHLSELRQALGSADLSSVSGEVFGPLEAEAAKRSTEPLETLVGS